MNIEQQVTSLDLSMKLKELGVKQDSLFYHQNEPYDDGENDIEIKIKESMKNLININDINDEHTLYSAFTSSELIALLPNRITLKEGEPFNSFTIYIKKSIIVKNEEINPYTSSYHINYECDSTECTGEDAWLKRPLFPHNIWDENFANALAKTLIYLIENKMI